MEGLLTNCPACSGKVSKAAASCPHCGHPIAAEERLEDLFARYEKIMSYGVPPPVPVPPPYVEPYTVFDYMPSYKPPEYRPCFQCDGKGSYYYSLSSTGRNGYNRKCEGCNGTGKININDTAKSLYKLPWRPD